MTLNNITDAAAISPEKNIAGMMTAFYHSIYATQSMIAASSRYANDFLIPYMLSTRYYSRIEQDRLPQAQTGDTLGSYLDLMRFGFDIYNRGLRSALEAAGAYRDMMLPEIMDAHLNTVFQKPGPDLSAFFERQAALMDTLAYHYPAAVEDIAPEYGFHFERTPGSKFDETRRFILYRVLPTDKKVTVDPGAKPVVIIPPYVLGANILAFLPGDNKSYAHSFANAGIPTYIRIVKEISSHEAVQTMTGEDDARDMRRFCEKVMRAHDRPVTLNGYCQGGFSAVCNLASGELDGLVDALITCVSPMDGTRSLGLKDFLDRLPKRFNDLSYGTKTLPNGNPVADGKLMGWVYKLKAIEKENPTAVFFRDLMMFARQKGHDFKISKTAAALNYWLINERSDLPLEITARSEASYNTPVRADGTLPVKLFGRKLNFKRLQERGIQWLICYGEHDDLVEKETALAPLDYVDAEVTAFPKGHVAMATSWSHPQSAYALQTRFGEENMRGPVRFQLDLEAEGKSDG